MTSPGVGLIENCNESTIDEQFEVVQFDLGDICGSGPIIKRRSADVARSENTLRTLKIQFDNWKIKALRHDEDDSFTCDLSDSLLATGCEMDKLGYFDDNKNVLCHLDLEPRNVLLSVGPETSISGVLDWDSAAFAPVFMS